MVLNDGRLVLDSPIAEAVRAYVTVAANELAGRPAIGTFAGTDGDLLALVAADSTGRPATLEEIVLGHLAAGRTQTQAQV